MVSIGVFAWQTQFPRDAQLQRAGVTSAVDQSAIAAGMVPYRIAHPGDDACSLEGEAIACGDSGETLDLARWWLTLVSSIFMATGFLQLAVNMLFLWLFGKSVEQAMGRVRFLLFYLLAGVVAAYAQALLDSGSTAPTIGATGALAGVMGAYALLHPRARILCFVLIPFFFTFVEIPALVVGGSRFALQLVPAIGSTTIEPLTGGAGVTFAQLIGGFLFGLAAVRLFARDRARAALEPPQTVY